MQNLKIYLEHRNFFILLARLITIIKHYGFSDKKFERVAKFYLNLLKKYNIQATFPVTADLLMKNDHMRSLARSMLKVVAISEPSR